MRQQVYGSFVQMGMYEVVANLGKELAVRVQDGVDVDRIAVEKRFAPAARKADGERLAVPRDPPRRSTDLVSFDGPAALICVVDATTDRGEIDSWRWGSYRRARDGNRIGSRGLSAAATPSDEGACQQADRDGSSVHTLRLSRETARCQPLPSPLPTGPHHPLPLPTVPLPALPHPTVRRAHRLLDRLPVRPSARLPVFFHTTVAHGSGGWSRISARTDRPRSSKARVGTDPNVMRTAYGGGVRPATKLSAGETNTPRIRA